MALLWRSTLVMVVMVLAAKSGIAAPPKTPKDPKDSKPPPPPCVFKAGNQKAEPKCTPNDEFTAMTKNVDSLSPYAKAYVLGAKARLACAKYDVKTPEGKAACNRDRDNRCFVSAAGPSCDSAMQDFWMYRAGCPGAPATDLARCASKYKDECKSTWGCGWADAIVFNGEPTKQQMDEFENATGGKPIIGGCTSLAGLQAGFNPAGPFKLDTYNAWRKSLANPDEYYTMRGTCYAAKQATFRVSYAVGCSSFNTPLPNTADSVSGLDPNYQAGIDCLNSACVVTPRNGTGLAYVPPTYFTCEVDMSLYLALELDPRKDGPVYRQYTLCAAPSLQRVPEICNGAPIV